MNIHLAVPHYNAPEQLDKFLSHATQLGFDAITVLDDASDDQEAVKGVASRYGSVSFVYGEQNVGAGGNRNRAIGQVSLESVVTFIDVDTEILTEDIADKLRNDFTGPEKRMIGGYILDLANKPMVWNYGHEMHPVKDVRFSELIDQLDGPTRDSAWQKLIDRGMDHAWLRRDIAPLRKPVDWVSEAVFALPMHEFLAVGGYDSQFRWHEGQDLARRLRSNGLEIVFDPTIVVRHLAIDVRGESRQEQIEEATYLFYKKHWGMSREVYDALKND